MIEPKRVLRALAEHWALLEPLCEHFDQGTLSLSELRLQLAAHQVDSTPQDITSVLDSWIRLDILVPVAKSPNRFELNAQIHDFLAYLRREHRLGLWAIRFLMLALAITPLRQLTGWNVLVRFRRMLGLYAFAYASLHLSAYLGLDLRGYWTQIFEDIAKRPYITVGFIAWLLLVPLAITSTTGWIKRLGRNWARLHMLVYAVAVLAVLHFWWLVKSDIREPALYAGIAALLLGWRLWKRWRVRTSLSARA